MKKFVPVVVLLSGLAVSPTLAQFSRGTIMVGGSLSYSHFKDKVYSGSASTTEDIQSTYSIQPQAGYFVLDNLAIGLGAGYQHGRMTEKIFTGHERYYNLTISPQVRYYYHNFYGLFSYQWGSGKTKFVGFDASDQSTKTYGWRTGLGYAILLNSHVAIEPQIGYNIQYMNRNGDNYDTDITAGFYVQAGIQIYLQKK